MFWLKKFVTYWLMPLQLIVVLCVAGLILSRTKRHAKLGRGLLLAGVLLLLLASNRPLGDALIGSIESQYAPVPELVAGAPLPPELARCRYIVVLGGGQGQTPGMSALTALSPPASSRVAEGVRLSLVLPEARCVFTGAGPDGRPSHARTLGRAAVSLGLAQPRVILAETPRDTENEALELRRIIGPDVPFALVTSASHMPRAMGLMRRQGLTPLACPTDFQSKPDPVWHWNDWLWNLEALGHTSSAAYERLGYLWAALRGKV